MALCRQPGCSRPASRYSVFCDEHHQHELQNAEAGSNLLRPSDIFRLMVGPLWLNALCITAAGGAALGIGFRWTLVLVLLSMAAAFAIAGWRLESPHCLAFRPEIQYPVAFVPSRRLHDSHLCFLRVRDKRHRGRSSVPSTVGLISSTAADSI